MGTHQKFVYLFCNNCISHNKLHINSCWHSYVVLDSDVTLWPILRKTNQQRLMKIFLRIIAVLLALFIIFAAVINLYFTDERLQEMIIPELRETTGSEIEAEKLSITFFRTFPRFGLEVTNLNVPDPQGETIASVQDLVLSLELFPLFSNEISISDLSVNQPVVRYHVFADSTTNIDFLLSDEQPENEDGYDISIPGFTLSGASLYYNDETTATSADLEQLNADISLFFSDVIESRVDAELGSLSLSVDGEEYLTDLSLSLDQTSTLDLDNEQLEFTEGTFSIRGLALNLTGSVSDWSSSAPGISLQFESTTDNFGELLRLAPPQYDEYLSELDTRGALIFEGTVEGEFTEDSLPRFDVILGVTDGFLQNPDLPDAIENINFRILFNNDLATVEQFSAEAGVNRLTASGTVERPLDPDATFSLELDGDVNLATISSFYPIDEAGIENLAGSLQTDARANGRIDQTENITFNGNFILSDGLLKFADVPNSIREINARVTASENRIQIDESGFTAEDNRFMLSGIISNPLVEENRSVDVTGDINFDLDTIKNFYPIDEDTLKMDGQLVAQLSLNGRPNPDQIENLLQRGTIELTDGYVSHKSLTDPIEDITFRAEARGNQLNISEAAFVNGENDLSLNGTVTNYLSDDPILDLMINGNAVAGSIKNYYTLEPWIQELAGRAELAVNAAGPANNIQNISLNGSLDVANIAASGDSLFLPVTNLSGRLDVTPERMSLNNFSMKFGSSDISLEGEMDNYLGLLDEHSTTETMPSVSGTYRSSYLNIDEMIDWDEEADEEPIPIELPELTASVDSGIDSLIIFGLPITDISGESRLNPDQILVENATADMFEGRATGRMEWNVPAPLQTSMLFEGKLDSLRAGAFFRDTGFLGPESTLHQFVSGTFNSEVTYRTQLSPAIEPDISTTEADGTFGMSKASIEGHPIQKEIAGFLKTPELEKLTLDEWNAGFSIQDTVMTLENFSITSGNLGIQLDGTLHMLNDQIDYKATLLLPERFKSGISSVISNRAADAMQLEDGRLAVPVRITGTTENPQVRPDTDTIDKIIQDYLKEGAGRILDRLFDGEN